MCLRWESSTDPDTPPWKAALSFTDGLEQWAEDSSWENKLIITKPEITQAW